jgi:hypothetical protein
MKKIKVKLLKCKNVSMSRYNYEDYYEEITKLVVTKFSDWEEVTEEEKDTLWRWTERHPDYILVVYDEEMKLEPIAIKEQLKYEEDLVKARKQQEEKYKEESRLRKEKAAKRRLESARKLLEKIEKEKAEKG